MNADILALWLSQMFLPLFFVLGGVLFCFGFGLALINVAGLSALFRGKE